MPKLPPKKPLTIRDVARQANISHVAVSKVINNCYQGEVSEVRAEEIRKLVRKLKYVPNGLAQNLSLGRTNTIIVASSSSLKYPHTNEIIEELHGNLVSHGYRLSLELLQFTKNTDQIYQSINRGRCDGFIQLGDPTISESEFKKFVQGGLPTVVVLGNFPASANPLKVDSVNYDREKSINLGLAHLWDLGHRRITVILGVGEMTASSCRYQACLEFFKSKNDPQKKITYLSQECSLSKSDIWGKINYTQNQPTAIFTYNEEIAMELAHDIRASGLNIPKDIALVTIGNWPHIRFSETPLTAIDYDNKQIAKTAVDCLINRIKNPEAPIQTVNFDPFLVFRTSTLPQR